MRILPSLPSRISEQLTAIAGGPMSRRLARSSALLPKIAALEPGLAELDNEQLRKRGLSLGYRAKSREPLDSLLPESYALVREAARRTIGMRHFDVQILGGIAMHHGSVVEMQTGEGKTLAATLPVFLAALVGKGAHLATANDYLAARDADWMRPVYETLGLSVGTIQADMPPPLRRQAYACDVTYGTAKEFGFDFLRDRLLLRSVAQGASDLLGGMLGGGQAARNDKPVQRGAHFMLVDEADSLLIDEASTPLIIGTMSGEAQNATAVSFAWASQVAGQFAEDQHYEFDRQKKKVELTAAGRRLVRSLPKPEAMNPVGTITMYDFVERAIKVELEFHRDQHYVVRDGEVVIVDEFTGRAAEGRKWRDGVHQAVEAKEGITVQQTEGHAARITVQDFFRRYERLAGMTGTAVTSAHELWKIYALRVIRVPTNRPLIRQRLPDVVFGTRDEKWAAIVEEVRRLHTQGRPVLVGTRSIDKSEHLSRLLDAAGIEHQVLNAHHVAAEAEIVAQAGMPGKVTVSTNMAGRGTDIKLGDGVADEGGLHVICTEMHDSARIDRQLMGRCGRQGDPGTCRQYLALDDDILLAGLGVEKARRLIQLGRKSPRLAEGQSGLFRRAQKKIERRNFRNRRILLYYEKERHKSHEQMGQDPYLDSPA